MPQIPDAFMLFRRAAAAALIAATIAAMAPASIAQTTPEPRRNADEAGLTDVQLLGKRLFEDTALSEPAGTSCASCHTPSHAFQGTHNSPIPAIAAGSTPDRLGTRKVPSLMYKSYSPPFGFYREEEDGKVKIVAKGGQFWDGRANSLAAQALGPLLNPAEMNNPSVAAVVAKVGAGPYAGLVAALYGPNAFAEPATAIANLTDAIAAYESSPRFAPFSSKFDAYLRGETPLSPEEMRGFQLFMDKKKGNCIACHAGKRDSTDPTDWLFTDFTYDALGAPRNPAIPANADRGRFDLGLCQRPGLAPLLPKSIKLNSLCGAFKVPSLRNVAITGPYYHNGAISSLREAVAIYATRDTAPARWFPAGAAGAAEPYNDLPKALRGNVNRTEVPYDRKFGQRPRLSEADVDALVAFLKTLTDHGME